MFVLIVERISKWSGLVVSYMILPMTGVVAVEVLILRSLLNSPTIWSQELTLFMFSAYFLIGGAYCLSTKGHVAMDVVYTRLGPRGKGAAGIFTFAAIFLVTGVMLWFGVEQAWEATLIGERSQSMWQPIIWPVLWAVPLGASLVMIQALATFIQDVLVLLRGERTKT